VPMPPGKNPFAVKIIIIIIIIIIISGSGPTRGRDPTLQQKANFVILT
jgi:hypothetical protein